MKNGCILCGGVGSGKSRTSLAYYAQTQGWDLDKKDGCMREHPVDLYIITTALKRDKHEWEDELPIWLMSIDQDKCYRHQEVTIDSWNNVAKYIDVEGAFFIFDEQRVVGYGKWTKSFLEIAKKNQWILLSATPGDTWKDYIPVFIANGFYKNKTQFTNAHIVYDYRAKFPKIDRYLNIGRLVRLRNSILVRMEYDRPTVRHDEDIFVDYNRLAYRDIQRGRPYGSSIVKWNPFQDKPIETASEFCQCLRRVVNSDESRQIALLELMEEHPKVIIFYNYDYELDILRTICTNTYGEEGVAEWNGHKHQEIPKGDRWAYLVQYTAGCEGWNCIITDTVIFYSQTYSYKVLEQASGRIDRLNTPYRDLYYYHLRSRSGIDLAITRALNEKRQFNEGSFSREARFQPAI